MNCPNCDKQLNDGFLYVRGLAASLFWSSSGDAKMLSRKELQQIDLEQLSTTPTGAQAVLPGYRCESCGIVVFNSKLPSDK